MDALAVMSPSDAASLVEVEDELSLELDPSAQLQAARRLDECLRRIRSLPGLDQFLVPPTIMDISRMSSYGRPFVYLLATEHETVAFIVPADEAARPAEGDQPSMVRVLRTRLLAPELVQALLRTEGDQIKGFVGAVQRAEGPELSQSLASLLELLGEKLMSPLADALLESGCSSAALIPTGLLGLVPLHAAILADAGSAGDVFQDRISVCYAPSALVFSGCQQRVAKRQRTRWDFVGIANPIPTSAAELPASESEVREIAKLFPRRRRRLACRSRATRRFFESHSASASYIHLACHGYSEVLEARRAALLLANDDRVSIGDLGGVGRLRCRLAVLSVCESARYEISEAPDELSGLPVEILLAGSAGVIGTLWPVDDFASALAMIRFYQLLLRDAPNEGDPASALRDAQAWLRSITDDEIDSFVKQNPSLRSFDRRRRVARGLRTNSNRPYGDPVLWAAFVLWGA
jgi:CHAT domain-containing protein